MRGYLHHLAAFLADVLAVHAAVVGRDPSHYHGGISHV